MPQCWGIINPDMPFKVVIEAHADEISWLVKYITDDDFIYVFRNSGSDHLIAPSKRVNIQSCHGKIIKAIFGWPAIHTRGKNGKEDTPTLQNIFLDCGAQSKKEVLNMGIQVGDVITYEDQFMVMNESIFVGRALDNRMGGFMMLRRHECLKKIKSNCHIHYI